MQKADLAHRIVAAVIDYMVLNFISGLLVVPFYCVMMMFIPFMERSSSRASGPEAMFIFTIICLVCLLLILSLAIGYAYYVWFPVKNWQGATIGKRVMKIRVVKSDGSEVGQGDMFLREFIGKLASGAVFYLGFLWIFFDEKAQGWHDKIADTWVVTTEK